MNSSASQPQPSTAGSPAITPAADQATIDEARALLRSARKGALATLATVSGHPYASMVLVATEPDGSPLLLISRLAVHTRNLAADGRASVLIDGTPAGADALAGARLTLVGTMQPSSTPTARDRFLARHAGARLYADFPDFGTWSLTVERAHFIAGFGRIVELPWTALVEPTEDAAALIAAESRLIADLTARLQPEICAIGAAASGGKSTLWQIVGVDPGGLELADDDGGALRVAFGARITTPAGAEAALRQLAAQAATSGATERF
jgi:putative heme iron utilization protein